MKTIKTLTHFIAKCEYCDFGTEDYINGKSQSDNHVRKTGHLVLGDFGYTFRSK